MKGRNRAAVGLVGAWLVVSLALASPRSPSQAQPGSDTLVEKGRAIYEAQGCAGCHQIGGKGGTFGPALDKLTTNHDAAWHRKHYEDPQSLVPGSTMPATKLPSDQMDALVAYTLSLMATSPSPAPPPESPPAPEKTPAPSREKATFVGSELCLGCHRPVQDAFSHTVHAELLSDKSIKAGKAGCEACHGPGSAHVATGGQKNLILQPAKLTAKEENAVCLKCHQTLLPKHDWLTSEHAAAKLSCSSCHVVMKQQFPRLLKAEERPLCLQCHAKVRTELSLNSHHPVLEGRLVCGACHDPHSGAQDKMLKEEQDRLCERCHADVQGPFAFEHPVSEGHFADGCLSCHLPHGSPNRALVRLPGRGLCLQCHTDKVSHRATTPSTRQSCTIVGCHNQIHGSNSDPLFLQ